MMYSLYRAKGRVPVSSRRLKQIEFGLVTAIIVAVLGVIWAVNPEQPGFFPPSPFRALTGYYCPGCGTLRGLHQLLHGHWLAALDYNPLMVLSLPFMVYAYGSYGLRAIAGRRILPSVRIPARWIWLLLQVILAYWVLRNLPFAPFSWLAP